MLGIRITQKWYTHCMRYVLLFAAIITLSAGQLFLKHGIDLAPAKANLLSIIHTLMNPFVILGFFFYGVSSILALFVLQKFPLSVALPSMSLTYVIILFASTYFFGEQLSSVKILAVLIIVAGVALLGKAS